MAEFDRLGRAAFLAKYGFGPAREYFLEHGGVLYDSKAVAGAAHGVQFPDKGALASADFSGGEATVARKLRALGFEVVRGLLASQMLDVGGVYTRAELVQQFAITDATIRTGVFQPKGYASIWLFVTEHKTPDRTRYVDHLDGDVLSWQGQLSGRTDQRIVEHAARGLELLVFYRRDRWQFPGAGFRYAGRFGYVRHTGARPASFVLHRIDTAPAAQTMQAEQPDSDAEASQAAARLLAAIAGLRRQGQTAPHKPLLLLLALERLRRGLPRLVAYTEIEQPLRQLLDAVSPSHRGSHPEYPFWRLQADGVWEVRSSGELPSPGSNTDPTASVLRASNARGGLLVDFDRLLRQRPELLDRAVETVLQHLPPDARAAALAGAGWEGATLPTAAAAHQPDTQLGVAYRPEDENIRVTEAAPARRDPDKVGRGLQAHRRTQRCLAEALTRAGLQPCSPARYGGPQYDLAWQTAEAVFVAEVKSLPQVHEEQQLRLGLGQVLRYRQQLVSRGKRTVAVLMVEHEPADPTWTDVCASAGVRLWWPACLPTALRQEP